MSWRTEFWIDEAKTAVVIVVLAVVLTTVMGIRRVELAVRRVWR